MAHGRRCRLELLGERDRPGPQGERVDRAPLFRRGREQGSRLGRHREGRVGGEHGGVARVFDESAESSEGYRAVVRVGADETLRKRGEGRLSRRTDIARKTFGTGAERRRAEPAEDRRQRPEVERSVIDSSGDRKRRRGDRVGERVGRRRLKQAGDGFGKLGDRGSGRVRKRVRSWSLWHRRECAPAKARFASETDCPDASARKRPERVADGLDLGVGQFRKHRQGEHRGCHGLGLAAG